MTGTMGFRRQKFRKVANGQGAAASTIKQLITPSKLHHHPRFDKILPSAMQELVALGLFIKDDSAEGGYKITALGKLKLAELEGKI